MMGHSDHKLTDKIYTDANLLPTGEVIRNLTDEERLTEILTEISGTDRQMPTRIVQRCGNLSDELKSGVLRVGSNILN